MPIHLLGLVLALAAAVHAPADSRFDSRFTGKTLRFDYFHSGVAKEEHVSLDGLRLEGDWPGSRVRLLDDSNLGKYLFEVIDLGSNQAIWSRGFSSIYSEWETTGEAGAGVWRTFHESMRFPEPRGRVQLVLKKRAADGAFREIYSTIADPASRFVDRSPVPAVGTMWNVFESGPPAVKVDLLILGDGYTVAEKGKFHADVKRLTDALFATEPYKSHRSDFNVRAIDVPSPASGVTDPRTATWRRTPLGLAYNAFDSERYMLTFADQAVRRSRPRRPTTRWSCFPTAASMAEEESTTCGTRPPWTAPSPPTCWSTSLATPSPAWGTSTTPLRFPTRPSIRREASRGSRTSRRSSIHRT